MWIKWVRRHLWVIRGKSFGKKVVDMRSWGMHELKNQKGSDGRSRWTSRGREEESGSLPRHVLWPRDLVLFSRHLLSISLFPSSAGWPEISPLKYSNPTSLRDWSSTFSCWPLGTKPLSDPQRRLSVPCPGACSSLSTGGLLPCQSSLFPYPLFQSKARENCSLLKDFCDYSSLLDHIRIFKSNDPGCRSKKIFNWIIKGQEFWRAILESWQLQQSCNLKW